MLPEKAAHIDMALAIYQRLRARHTDFYRLASRALTPAFQSDDLFIPRLRDALLLPMNRIPGGRYLTATTLSGVRKFPLGIWRLPV